MRIAFRILFAVLFAGGLAMALVYPLALGDGQAVDPRAVPLGLIFVAVGVIGMVLTFLGRRPPAGDHKPRRWGRGG